MNFNLSTTTATEIPNQTQDSKLYEYDGDDYSEYYYSGKVQIELNLISKLKSFI